MTDTNNDELRDVLLGVVAQHRAIVRLLLARGLIDRDDLESATRLAREELERQYEAVLNHHAAPDQSPPYGGRTAQAADLERRDVDAV